MCCYRSYFLLTSPILGLGSADGVDARGRARESGTRLTHHTPGVDRARDREGTPATVARVMGPGATVIYEFNLPPKVGHDQLALTLQAASGSSPAAAGGLALEVFDHATLHWDLLDMGAMAGPAAGRGWLGF